MQLPEEAYTAELTDYQFRLLAHLYRKTAPEGSVSLSVKQMQAVTGGVSQKTVRRALAALERAGFITRTRTRRQNGYRGTDVINLKTYRTSQSPSLEDKNVHTSHDYRSRSHTVDKPLVPNSQSSNQLKEFESKIRMKEVRIPMRKWEDDGDSLAGFGLVEPKDASQPKVKRSDPRTRGKRPEHEWTPMDVAAEFSYRVGKKYPLLPGTVNVRQLSGALGKFRKQYQTTALIELELLRLFMADERNFQQIGDEAPLLYKKYLASFGTKMNQARDNLGLNKVTAKIDTTSKASTLTASDGRVFQNSLSGRAQLERHEKRLKEKTNG